MSIILEITYESVILQLQAINVLCVHIIHFHVGVFNVKSIIKYLHYLL